MKNKLIVGSLTFLVFKRVLYRCSLLTFEFSLLNERVSFQWWAVGSNGQTRWILPIPPLSNPNPNRGGTRRPCDRTRTGNRAGPPTVAELRPRHEDQEELARRAFFYFVVLHLLSPSPISPSLSLSLSSPSNGFWILMLLNFLRGSLDLSLCLSLSLSLHY